jgi:hypothetical protein
LLGIVRLRTESHRVCLLVFLFVSGKSHETLKCIFVTKGKLHFQRY